jgi:hypothetical protein
MSLVCQTLVPLRVAVVAARRGILLFGEAKSEAKGKRSETFRSLASTRSGKASVFTISVGRRVSLAIRAERGGASSNLSLSARESWTFSRIQKKPSGVMARK